MPLLDGMSLEAPGLVEPVAFEVPEFIDELLESIDEPVLPVDGVVAEVELFGSVVVVVVDAPALGVVVEPVMPGVVVVADVVLSEVVPAVPGAELAVLPAVPVLPLSIGVVPVEGLPVLPLLLVPWAIAMPARPAAMASAAAPATTPVRNLFMSLLLFKWIEGHPGEPGLGAAVRQSPCPSTVSGR